DRAHLAKVLAERKEWKATEKNYALGALKSSNSFIIRASADALGRHAKPEQIRDLLTRLAATPAVDNHLSQTLRMPLRDHIAALPNSAALEPLKLTDSEQSQLASICLGVPAPVAAAILTNYLKTHDDNLTAYLQHAARYADTSLIGDVVRVGESKATADIEVQAQIIQSLASGLGQRGGADLEALAAWAGEVAMKLLASDNGEQLSWTAVTIGGL